jgi:hypothetical protein
MSVPILRQVARGRTSSEEKRINRAREPKARRDGEHIHRNDPIDIWNMEGFGLVSKCLP